MATCIPILPHIHHMHIHIQKYNTLLLVVSFGLVSDEQKRKQRANLRHKGGPTGSGQIFSKTKPMIVGSFHQISPTAPSLTPQMSQQLVITTS